ncbi:fibronectin type III domain-containing protein [Dactylosporangium sp. CS-033363]|uniref:fibronectin type III domain-containing protein n=1 Tax=Dactylosporangium sp. CS-033363 TaxID=3239935 RepID=UPI003D9361BE
MWYPRLAAALVLPLLATLLAAPAVAAVRPDAFSRFAGTAKLAQLAAEADGSLVGADPTGDRVVRIAPGGDVTEVAGGAAAGLDRPEGVAVGGDGTVYVSDARHRVARITPDGRLRIVAGNGSAGAAVPGLALASPLTAPAGLAADRDGNLYIADAGSILRVTPAGALSVVVTSGSAGSGSAGSGSAGSDGRGSDAEVAGRGVAVDSLGNLFVSGPDCTIARIAPSGERSTYAGRGCGRPVPGRALDSRLGPAAHLSTDEHDVLYVADAAAGTVAAIAPDGMLTLRGSRTSGRSAVANAAGTVFVAAPDGVHRIGPATPSAPRDLRVAPRDRALEVSFRAPLDPGTEPISSYEVSLDGTQTWQPLTTAVAGDRLTGSVRGLGNGVQYAVVVWARNAAGPSPGSTILPAVPGAIVQAALDGTGQRADSEGTGLRADSGGTGLRADSGGTGLRADSGGTGLRADSGGTGLRADSGGTGLRADSGGTGLRADSGGSVVRARPDDAFLPVTGGDVAGQARMGGLAVLLGSVLLLIGTAIRWNGMERASSGVRSAP